MTTFSQENEPTAQSKDVLIYSRRFDGKVWLVYYITTYKHDLILLVLGLNLHELLTI